MFTHTRTHARTHAHYRFMLCSRHATNPILALTKNASASANATNSLSNYINKLRGSRNFTFVFKLVLLLISKIDSIPIIKFDSSYISFTNLPNMCIVSAVEP